MASFVQRNQDSSDTPLAVAFDSNVTAGSLLLAIVRIGSLTETVTISDNNGGTTWSGTPDVGYYSNGSAARTAVFSAPNASAGATTITATASAGGIALKMIIIEVSGAATASPFDAASTNLASSGTSLTTNSVTTAAATAFLVTVWNTNGPLGSFTPTDGSTSRTEFLTERLYVSTRSAGAAGSYSGAATADASENWSGLIAAYKDFVASSSSVSPSESPSPSASVPPLTIVSRTVLDYSFD
jgi:hypothetical protein